MISKKNLLKHPNYLLSKYQIEIFRQLETYRQQNDLTQRDLAAKLNVSTSYVNQILKGKFNFTLKKLIELAIAIGKVPSIEFLTVEDFWTKNEVKKQNTIIAQLTQESQILIKVQYFTNAEMSSTSGVSSNETLEVQDAWISQSLN